MVGKLDWIDLAQGRDQWRALVSSVINLRVPWTAGNFLSTRGTFSFSSRTVLTCSSCLYNRRLEKE